MPPTLPAATDLLCERCGYILRGLAEAANCPECGLAIGRSAGGHRRPSTFEVEPSLGSLLRTALAVIFRPGRFFRGLATRPVAGTRAAWFARCHRFVAAVLLSVAACGLVIIDHTFPVWLYRVGWGRDEPEVFGLMLPLVMAAAYVGMVLAGRVVAAVVAALAAGRPVRLPPAVVRRAMCFHSVNFVPAAFLVAAAVGGPLALLVTPMAVICYVVVAQLTAWLAGGRMPRRPFRPRPAGALALLAMALTVARYFWEFGGPRFEPVGEPPADWRTYRYTIAAAVVASACYLTLTGWIAIRNVMYANDAIAPAAEGAAA